MNVALPTVESVNKFCSIASKFDNDIDVKYRHYVLDAKSVLGVQSIPRNEQLEIFIHGVDLNKDDVYGMVEAFDEFAVK